MFKDYTINQTTLPLDMEQFISETDVAFAVNSLFYFKIYTNYALFSKCNLLFR